MPPATLTIADQSLPPLPSSAQLVVADSFRVRGVPGQVEVRGWQLHRARFRSSVLAALTPVFSGQPQGLRSPTPPELLAEQLDTFLSGAASAIAAHGPGFPRLELWQLSDTNEWQLRLAVRPLPQLGSSLQTAFVTGVKLQHPERKGPNIATFTELNRSLGCEALLVHTPSGTSETDDQIITEGATTSMLWWEGDTLCRNGQLQRVPSVTEALVCAAASAAGYPVAVRQLTVSAVRAHEVWAVNALHGIRPVTHVNGAAVGATVQDSRLHILRTALDATWEPLLPHPDETV